MKWFKIGVTEVSVMFHQVLPSLSSELIMHYFISRICYYLFIIRVYGKLCDIMPSPNGDPTYIKNKEYFFMEVALTIAKASTHPKCPGGCIIVRDKEIVGDGRSLLTD